MSKYLLLKNFNSYHNRVIKRYDSISDYINNSEDAVWNETRNFMPNDGINSKIVYNYKPDEMNWVPDYLIQCDNDSNIEKRYFVMEAVRTRNGQYDVDLRRDVVADYYDNILDANTFIEKATITDTSNPFLFNKEDMTFNQIKRENEILLKDETQVPWLIGYVAISQDVNDSPTISGDISIDATTVAGISNFLPSLRGKTLFYKQDNMQLIYKVNPYLSTSSGDTTYKVNMGETTTVSSKDNISSSATWRYKEKYLLSSTTRTNLKNAVDSYSDIKDNMNNAIKSIYEGKHSSVDRVVKETSVVDTINNNNGKYVRDTETNKLYKVNVTREFIADAEDYGIGSTVAGQFGTQATLIANQVFDIGEGYNQGIFMAMKGLVVYNLEVLEVQTAGWTSKISGRRRKLNDAPYCMFAIPYGDVTIVTNAGEFTSQKDVGLNVASRIAEKLSGAGTLYDLQLLPYFPRRDIIKNGKIDIRSLSVDVDYTLIASSVEQQTIFSSAIIWCNYSSDTFDIPVDLPSPQDALEIKVENETSFYRLSSPNYSGQFEFNVAKNNGVSTINVDYTYKPYTPYIHANPMFGGLYGFDTDDTRGLICGGDFSLAQTSDQWATYELNNKNYNNSFNRQIENMDVMRKYERADQIVNASVGAIGAGLTAGLSTGNVGIGIGAGVVSAIGGSADVVHSEKKYQETIDYTKDQFGFNLGNIKARPDTLAKVSAFNKNNKVFLFLEHYDCTPEEKEALREKIKYNGMSIGVIGKIGDYVQSNPTYIKGKIIRIYTGDDAHMNSEIYNELYKGVFI